MSEQKVKKHSDNEHLTGEHPAGDVGQIVLLIIFLGVWISDSFIFHYSTVPADYISLWIRLPIGMAVSLFSGYMAKTTLKIIFGTERNKPEVIRESFYNITRHPMYFSILLLYFGLFLITFSLAALLFIIPVFAFYNFIASHEEKLLLNEFGEEYQNYMKNVGRWFPKT